MLVEKSNEFTRAQKVSVQTRLTLDLSYGVLQYIFVRKVFDQHSSQPELNSSSPIRFKSLKLSRKHSLPNDIKSITKD